MVVHYEDYPLHDYDPKNHDSYYHLPKLFADASFSAGNGAGAGGSMTILTPSMEVLEYLCASSYEDLFGEILEHLHKVRGRSITIVTCVPAYELKMGGIGDQAWCVRQHRYICRVAEKHPWVKLMFTRKALDKVVVLYDIFVNSVRFNKRMELDFGPPELLEVKSGLFCSVDRKLKASRMHTDWRDAPTCTYRMEPAHDMRKFLESEIRDALSKLT